MKIKNLRLSKGLTQEDLSGKVGISQALLSLIEKDLRKPSYKVACSIAHILGVSVEELGLEETILSKIKKKIFKLNESDLKSLDIYLDFLLHKNKKG